MRGGLSSLARKASWVLLIMAFAPFGSGSCGGPVVKGARLGFLWAMSSEVAKLACIVWLSGYLDRHRSQITDLRRVSPPLLVLGLVCALILKEPIRGTPLLLGATGFCSFSIRRAPIHILGPA